MDLYGSFQISKISFLSRIVIKMISKYCHKSTNSIKVTTPINSKIKMYQIQENIIC